MMSREMGLAQDAWFGVVILGPATDEFVYFLDPLVTGYHDNVTYGMTRFSACPAKPYLKSEAFFLNTITGGDTQFR